MKFNLLAAFFLLILVSPSSASLERIELGEGVDLIITNPEPNYYLLSLINMNDYNVTLVKDIQVNVSEKIIPSSVTAFDNYERAIVPDDIEGRTITLTYNNTLPALGYGKIFLNTSTPLSATTTTSSTTTSTTLPEQLPPDENSSTLSTFSEDFNPTLEHEPEKPTMPRPLYGDGEDYAAEKLDLSSNSSMNTSDSPSELEAEGVNGIENLPLVGLIFTGVLLLLLVTLILIS